MNKPVVFLKSHVEPYTKKDGTTVAAHERLVNMRAHPKGYKPGQHVFFPHPQKKGKNGLGIYMGEREGKSVVHHVHGEDGNQHDVEHDQVKGARGIPKPADPAADAEKNLERAKGGNKSGVPDDHLELMEQSLANDENSSDEELHDHFVSSGVHPDHAREAIKHREKFTSAPLPAAGELRRLMAKKD
jgi:hypothetical protein